MADKSKQLTYAEKAKLWVQEEKQQQHNDQHSVRQQHHTQQLSQKSQQQLAVRDKMDVMTFTEKAELWYKKQQQPKYDQQEQQKKQQHPIQEKQQSVKQRKQYEHNSVQKSDTSVPSPIQTPDSSVPSPIQSPDSSVPSPIQSPDSSQQSPIQSPDSSVPSPIQSPDSSVPSPIQSPDSSQQSPIQTSDLSGQDPIQTPDPIGQGCIHISDPIQEGLFQTSDPSRQDPIQTPDPSGQGPFQTQGLTVRSLQHPQKKNILYERKPTDSQSDIPQSSVVPDVMSIVPSVPCKASESHGRQDFNDDSRPETLDLSASKKSTRKGDKTFSLETKKEQVVSFIRNPRRGQIMKVEVSDMEALCSDEEIGKGSFGTVYKAKIQNEGKDGKYVIKKILVDGYNDFHMKSYAREIHHGRILHPYIIPIIAWAAGVSESTGFVYLMYPFMENGSVYQNIEKENEGKRLCQKDRSNSKIWLRCLYQISEALEYMHKPGKNNLRQAVFHQDLTSRNILFDEDFNVKICDFGMAVEAKHHTSNATATPIQQLTGYHPKSMIPNQYRAYVDVYSFSVLVLEILTGEVVKKESPLKKYRMVEVLLQTIEKRGNRIEVAQWEDGKLREKLARKAYEIIELDATEGKKDVRAADFFKDERIETRNRYQQPKNKKRCVACYVNPRAKNLKLMGEECKGHNPHCAMHCIYCLSDYQNQPFCPLHGPSRPPFGDHVYGVFIAGNHVKHFQGKENKTETKKIADIFAGDATKIASVLKFPLTLGVRNEHLEVVMPKEPGKEGEMVDSIRKVMDKINTSIRGVLRNPNHDRLENSLFIFYFTGHGSKEDGLYLGSEKETINDSTDWLKQMLCETLRVDQVLVILDCCHAAEQNFARKKERSNVGILQLSSCDKDEKSFCMERGIKRSVFTHFLCQALQGDNFIETDGYFTKLCTDCKDYKKNNPNECLPCEDFHQICSNRQCVTGNSIKNYIRGHYEILGMTQKMKEHCDDVPIDEFHLGYYKPEMSCIPIHLKGNQNGEKYSINSHPESMSKLKQRIVCYIDDKNIPCQLQNMLDFYKQLLEDGAVEKTSCLIAIHPKAEREAKELLSLEDLWKIITCGRVLEAKIRDNLDGLSCGSNVKVEKLKRIMTRSIEQDYNEDGLKISQEFIHVEVNSINDVIKSLIHLQKIKSAHVHPKLTELLKTLQEILLKVLDNSNIEGTMLKFQLYDEFSIVEVI